MGDKDYKVVTEALRKEAPKWHDFADQVEVIRRVVQEATLDTSAFFCGNPVVLMVPDLNAQLHQAAYESYRYSMESLLAGAVAEFPQICQAMIEMADEYDAHEELVALDLNKIYDAAQWY